MGETQGEVSDAGVAPLYLQVARLVEDSILDGTVHEGERVPSTNELARFHGINPATARRGLHVLVEAGVLENRRGMGTYVTPEAVQIVRQRRREVFVGALVVPMVDEALRLGIKWPRLNEVVRAVGRSRGY